MNAQRLLQDAKLDEAIELLGAELKADPTSSERRTFLFELLCFAGDYGRAEKQLDILSEDSAGAAMGALLYKSALHADRLRHEMFLSGHFPDSGADDSVTGTLNGKPFTSIHDVDSRIGARLEIYAAGQYTWIPFNQIASVSMEPPKQLRDLLWAPAKVETNENFGGVELGEILIPVLAPLSNTHADSRVRLGRMTEYENLDDGGEAVFGLKMLWVDEEEIPFLEIRELEFHPISLPTG